MKHELWTGRRVLSIANLKGGVGKSTTSMMIADALSYEYSVRVLVVDLDPQANVSQMLLSYRGLQNAKNTGLTLTDWVENLESESASKFFTYANAGVSGLHELNPRNKPQHARSGDLAVVPATPELRFSELSFDHRCYESDDRAAPTQKMIGHLKGAIDSLEQSIDLVLFDCPPGFSTLSQAALSISDGIISPILEEPLGAWSLKAFRDFGLIQTLGIWDVERHKVLFSRVSRRGALDERRDVRHSVSEAGFSILTTSIKDSAQAHRWVQRPAPDSRKRFASKYGQLRRSVIELGDEVVTFLAELTPLGAS
jgi:chromosome partitioning protein